MDLADSHHSSPSEPPTSPYSDGIWDAESTSPPREVSSPDQHVDPMPTTEEVDIVAKLQADIAKRTAAQDTATAQKEKEIKTEAEKYIENLKRQHETSLQTSRAAHRQAQDAKTEQLKHRSEADSIWKNVGILVDLTKPNKFSKRTERMRSALAAVSKKK